MKFTIKNEILKKALELTTKAISSKITIPIMGTLQFDFLNEGGTKYVSINASDFENTINYYIYNIDFNERLDMLIINEPLILKTFLNKIDNEKELEFVVHEKYTELKVGRQVIELSSSLIKDDVLPLPEFDKDLSLTFDYNDFISSVKLAGQFVGHDPLRPIMNGISFIQKDDNIEIVSTDSNVLFKLTSDFIEGSDFNFVVNPSILKLLPSKSEKEITIAGNDKTLMISVDNIVVYTRLIEGKYPSYNSVIPTNYNKEIIISKDELLSKIDNASLFSEIDNLGVLEITKNKLFLFTENAISRKSYKAEIEVNSTLGDDIKIGFHLLKLLNILKTINTEEVLIRYNDPSKALLIYPKDDEQYLYLLMPMMITK
jgi:DNA polymerase-3 subunit beta